MRQYSVLLISDDVEGGYTALVPILPGIITEGATVEEALANAREAIELHLEGLAAEGEAIPEEFQPPMLLPVATDPDLPEGTAFSSVHEHFIHR